jgi:hypothetical protein
MNINNARIFSSIGVLGVLLLAAIGSSGVSIYAAKPMIRMLHKHQALYTPFNYPAR